MFVLAARARAASGRGEIDDMEPVNLDHMLTRFTEHWSPKTIAQVNDYDVRIVKVRGEFTWHRHVDSDEFFLVLTGQLTIQMRDRDVVLRPQELFVVPRGVEHCPRADTETALVLFEPASVVNTGDAGGELTAEIEQLTESSWPGGRRPRSRMPGGHERE
jgi:mannose-6-phosphate isomerase-like protein (cupin superfamily)